MVTALLTIGFLILVGLYAKEHTKGKSTAGALFFLGIACVIFQPILATIFWQNVSIFTNAVELVAIVFGIMMMVRAGKQFFA